ncbi:MAG: hypothetical protein P8101_05745, partial [Candidatus Thiodiazotropha sp.]
FICTVGERMEGKTQRSGMFQSEVEKYRFVTLSKRLYQRRMEEISRLKMLSERLEMYFITNV